MIFLNTDKVFSSTVYKSTKTRINKLKGKVMGNILIVEDIFDFAPSSKRKQHLCLCKCLTCGKVWVVKRDRLGCDMPCGCSQTSTQDYMKQKNIALSILDREYNILKNEAVFDEDYKRLDDIAFVRKFVSAV